ncbi:BRO1 domain-containing protein BROX isoform X2 [Onychostruthus taczanowskii]|uniref:BRO1 domain-containing protein BROX isoform X2 n=1 Tax=Onychostruthus taczanowskii TaxID=356909 RepID=UPI001B80D861|nr:BRO1 domain-containing protein BROX isoform X2 [Onychostruthus taczanowskii]
MLSAAMGRCHRLSAGAACGRGRVTHRRERRGRAGPGRGPAASRSSQGPFRAGPRHRGDSSAAQIWHRQHCRKKMTHWFHRNPLKATAPISFNYYGVTTTPAATKVCNDLRLSRTQLLELFTDSSCNPEIMKNAADLYFSLLQGFILSLDDSSQECKLRYIQNFKWTDTLQGQVPSITEDEAKDVHRSLKIAAGIFKHLKESHIPKLITPVEKGRDLEARLIDSYIIQCQAEAQEVTIARAIELKHNPGLIAALAYETANFYQKADQTLSSLVPAYAGKWRKYLNLKSCFYMAYAYCYHGQTLLASDKCGEAIRSLQESEKFFAKAEALCKEYGETKGPGTTAKPSGHLFFRKLGSLIKNTLEKCQRENGFIYFQKVPAEAPQLELKANYGLVEPVPFEFPALNAHWTPEAVAAFDLTKRPKEDAAKPKPDEEIKPLKEPNIKPQKDSGCQIS